MQNFNNIICKLLHLRNFFDVEHKIPGNVYFLGNFLEILEGRWNCYKYLCNLAIVS